MTLTEVKVKNFRSYVYCKCKMKCSLELNHTCSFVTYQLTKSRENEYGSASQSPFWACERDSESTFRSEMQKRQNLTNKQTIKLSHCFSKNKNSPVLISTSDASHVDSLSRNSKGTERTPGGTPDFWTSPKDSFDLRGFQIIPRKWKWSEFCPIQFQVNLVLRDLTRNSGYFDGIGTLQHWEQQTSSKRDRLRRTRPRIHQLPCLITGKSSLTGSNKKFGLFWQDWYTPALGATNRLKEGWIKTYLTKNTSTALSNYRYSWNLWISPNKAKVYHYTLPKLWSIWLYKNFG